MVGCESTNTLDSFTNRGRTLRVHQSGEAIMAAKKKSTVKAAAKKTKAKKTSKKK